MRETQKILIVDDERINRRHLAALLEENYEVLQAKNGEQALERLANTPQIDLVLLDVMMPIMDGYEVLRRIKEVDRLQNVPVIFITALGAPGDEEKGLRLGASDYIAKPFHPAIVRLRVENHLRFVRQRKLLETLVGRDGLTEINNRRAFDEALDRVWNDASSEVDQLSVAMIDVDHFKNYNDTYGHAVGDQALKKIATILQGNLPRPEALAARYGGEEFVLMLPSTPLVEATLIAEQARLAVESLNLEHRTSDTADYVTISLGVASATRQEISSASALLEAADQQLYLAKKGGRNRVMGN